MQGRRKREKKKRKRKKMPLPWRQITAMTLVKSPKWAYVTTVCSPVTVLLHGS